MIYIDRMTNYFKYINKKDLEKFSDLFADASVYYDWNTVYSGKSTIIDLFHKYFSEEPDQVWHVDDYAINERHTVFAKCSVMYHFKDDINVTKVFKFNSEGKINLVQAYKQ